MYMHWENARIQTLIYQREMGIQMAQEELKKKMNAEKRLYEIMQS